MLSLLNTSFTVLNKKILISPLVKAYIERVRADGGTVEAIRCLKDPGLDVYDWKYYFRVMDDGTQKVVNGDFATDSDWNYTTSINWSIVSGFLLGNSSEGSVTQLINTVIGEKYRITFEISDYISGNVYVRPSYGSGTSFYIGGDGSYVEEFTATTTSTSLVIRARPSQPFNGSISNVSVKTIPKVESLECVTL